MRATGIGSMPGDDLARVARFVVDALGAGGIVFVPELPARGMPAGMVGRTLGLLPLPFDLQPAGWRAAPGEGIDQRRARSLLRADLDTLEEVLDGLEVTVKQQLVGPLTLAATVERGRGDKLLADHGARRELAEALAAAVTEHVGELQRRFPLADLVVQVDEPAIGAVLRGAVPTASGFGRHRTVHPPEADALLRAVVDAVREAGARPVAHVCATDVPIALLRGAGFDAVAFDLALTSASDDWAEAFEAGTDLWAGIAPTDGSPFDDAAAHRRLVAWLDRLGFGQETWHDRVVVAPACGLAGASPTAARDVLTRLAALAA